MVRRDEKAACARGRSEGRKEEGSSGEAVSPRTRVSACESEIDRSFRRIYST